MFVLICENTYSDDVLRVARADTLGILWLCAEWTGKEKETECKFLKRTKR